MSLSKLTQELALALEIASIKQAWGIPSPFQDKINELLVKAGRKPVTLPAEDQYINEAHPYTLNCHCSTCRTQEK